MTRGKRKPAREMTTEEMAERLFGKRVVRKVEKELEVTQPTENTSKSRKKSIIKKKGS